MNGQFSNVGFGQGPSQNPQVPNLSGAQGEAIMNFGVAYGKDLLNKVDLGQANAFADKISAYFQVNHSFVKNKLKIVLFPFIHKGLWKRQAVMIGDGAMRPLEPAADINAPDLYIPLMAFFSWILLRALYRSTFFSMSPDFIVSSASRGLTVFIIDVLLAKLCMYLTSSTSFPMLDAIAFVGYVFVPATVAFISTFLFPPLVSIPLSLVLGSLFGYFLMKSLKMVVFGGPVSSYEPQQSSMNSMLQFRNGVLFAISGLQILVTLFLSLPVRA